MMAENRKCIFIRMSRFSVLEVVEIYLKIFPRGNFLIHTNVLHLGNSRKTIKVGEFRILLLSTFTTMLFLLIYSINIYLCVRKRENKKRKLFSYVIFQHDQHKFVIFFMLHSLLYCTALSFSLTSLKFISVPSSSRRRSIKSLFATISYMCPNPLNKSPLWAQWKFLHIYF